MIDPDKITDFKRTIPELEEYSLFCMVVAGKTAKAQAVKLEAFLNYKRELSDSPYEHIKRLYNNHQLIEALTAVKMGQYNRLSNAFLEATTLNVKTCTVEELEAVPGIGPKTARYFLMHSRPNQRVATLDVHILRWMRENLGIDTPKQTPSGKKYRVLEEAFLNHADKTNQDPAELDLQIWLSYRRDLGEDKLKEAA